MNRRSFCSSLMRILLINPPDWNKVIEVNLTGQFLCAQEAVRRFRRQGGTDASTALGKIIFNSSVHQAIPWASHANYATAKGGLKLLMQSMAQELSCEKIRVNAIAPGPIDTEANRTTTPQEMVADIVKGIPLSRMGETDDLVGMCLFLLSDQAKWVTGQIFNVDGGQIIR